jgi:hypothetical protein
MSDADDQLDGTGGKVGGEPGRPDPRSQPENGIEDPKPDVERSSNDVDRNSEASFPASDPPGTY